LTSRYATVIPLQRRLRSGGLLGAAVVYLFALGVTGAVFVGTSGGQELDGRLLLEAERSGLYRQDLTIVEPARAVLSLFGNIGLLAVLLGGVVLVAALTGRWWAGVAGVGVFVGSIAAATLLKQVIERPELGVEGSSTHNSFASGHAAAAMGLLCAGLLVVPARARWWLAIPGATAVSVIASATMVVGWHRPSDVIGGTLLASALCCVAAAVLVYRRGVPRPQDGSVWLKGALLLVVTPLPMLVTAMALPAGDELVTAIITVSVVTALAVVPVVMLLAAVDFAAGVERPVCARQPAL
jgi:membrane-associated phospholipid phosphatase